MSKNKPLKCPMCDGEGDKQLIDYASQFICSECHFSCPMGHYSYRAKEAKSKKIMTISTRINGVWVTKTPNKTNISLIIK